MSKLENQPHQESKERNLWRSALVAILAIGLTSGVLRSACSKEDRTQSHAPITVRHRPRVRITPMPNYFAAASSNPLMITLPANNGGLDSNVENSPFGTNETNDGLTVQQRRLQRDRELCRIGGMVATDIQARLAQTGGVYSFATLSTLTREILTADYDIPNLPDEDNPAHAETVRICLEDEIDMFALQQGRAGSRTSVRRIIAAGGSIPSVFAECDLGPFDRIDAPSDAVTSCLHELLDERFATLSGLQLQKQFELVFANDPDLAFTFFNGARIEIKTAILAALNAIIATQSETIARFVRERIEHPERGGYVALQLAIMRPLSDYQLVLDALSSAE